MRMKRFFFLAISLCSVIASYSQRYSGHGRGVDFDDRVMNYEPSYWFVYLILGLIILGIPFFIYQKKKERKGIKSGKYIRIVSNGYIQTTDNLYNKHLEVEKTWKFTDFESLFGKATYETKMVNMSHKNIFRIICTKNSIETIIYVPFDCYYDGFFQNYEKFRVAQVHNGSFVLYKKG